MKMLITNYVNVESVFLKGGCIGESGTDEIIKLLLITELYDQFPTEFALLTLTTNESFLEVSANSFLKVNI